MLRTIVLVGLLSFGIALDVYADDSGRRIDRLEKDVQELKLRLSELESLLSHPGDGQKVITNGAGWESVANWRKLTTDMGYDDVEQILGKPERVKGGNVAHWHYPNRGRVTFFLGKVNSWSEPLQ